MFGMATITLGIGTQLAVILGAGSGRSIVLLGVNDISANDDLGDCC